MKVFAFALTTKLVLFSVAGGRRRVFPWDSLIRRMLFHQPYQSIKFHIV
jgi:hypothetical protein